jgi:hypothetical protein
VKWNEMEMRKITSRTGLSGLRNGSFQKKAKADETVRPRAPQIQPVSSHFDGSCKLRKWYKCNYNNAHLSFAPPSVRNTSFIYTMAPTKIQEHTIRSIH